MTAELVGGKEFLERYFRGCDGSNIELRALHIIEKSPTKVVHQKAYSDIEALLADAEKLAGKFNVYFNTAALNGGFDEDHAVVCPALRIDIDFKAGITEDESRKMLAAFPLRPSAIIHSGGGLQVYWFLAEPAGRVDFHRVKAIIKSLAFTFRADLGACDIPRILRLPNTVNRKPIYNPPRPVTLAREDWHPEREFSLSDFAALLPIEGEVQQPPAEKTSTGRLLPLDLIGTAFEQCEALDRYKWNATEAGRLLPEDDPREHAARIAFANYCRAFEGGEAWAEEAIFRHLNDYNPKETRKQFASLTAPPPRCDGAGLCPEGQCDAIKTLGKQSPIAFVYETRKDLIPSPIAAEGLEDFRATDLWNARLFVHLHGDKVRYCERLGGWHYYDGKRWTRETCGEVERLAKDLPPVMYRMASEEPDEAKRQAIAKHAAKTEAVGKLAAILELAKTEPGIAVPPEVFDAHPWKFNTATGTLDIQTGEEHPHRPEDMLTNLSPAEWRGLDAKGERFEQFLHEAMDGDREKIDFLQRRTGYTITGDMREQVFFFDHGPEAAGKGTFDRAVSDVMGTYARSTEIGTFLTARRDTVRNDVASLVGARLVTASEPEDGQVFDEGLIKILTGQDKTAARFLFREAFEFAATFKLWLQGNHRPHIRSTGGAMWRRLLIVPFTKTVPEDLRDKTLGEKLRTPEERAGILAWMVRGCLEWQRAGLRPPNSVRAAVAEYRRAEDRLAPFLEERTAASEYGQVPAGKLYVEYRTWAEANGERPMSKRALGLRLEEKGYRQARTTKTRAWEGLLLVNRGDGE